MNDFYVYALLDPSKFGIFTYGEIQFEFEPFYIGKGRKSRMYTHECLSQIKDTKTRKRAKIKGILDRGLKLEKIKLFKNLSESEAFYIERNLILLIGRNDIKLGPLYNLTNGGEGASGKMSESHKLKISNSLKNIPKSKIHNENVSKSLLGKEKSQQHKVNLSISTSKYFENHIHVRSIRVINLNTLTIYDSAHHAARSINGHPSHILEVCKGKRKSHKKYKWAFYD